MPFRKRAFFTFSDQEKMPLYLFVMVLFIMGVIFGALMVNALTPEQNQETSLYLSSFFHSIAQGTDFSNGQTFWQVIAFHLKWAAVIWFLGLSVIGIPFIFVLDFLKGLLIGFTVGYLTGEFTWKGFLFVFVSVVPQNILLIPAIMIFSVSAVSFSIYLLKNRVLQQRGSIYEPFKEYVAAAMFALFLMGLASGVESYITPFLMKWANPIAFAN